MTGLEREFSRYLGPPSLVSKSHEGLSKSATDLRVLTCAFIACSGDGIDA